MKRRMIAPATALAAAALLVAGCGGGGGGGASADAGVAPLDASMPIAAGAGADQSASLAIAALGNPGSVDPSILARTLDGYDSFGAPHDAFAQQVDQTPGSGSEASSGVPLPADTPINTDPLVPVSGDAVLPPDGTVTDPIAGAPVQSPTALEADFDISGEPVVAREGDAIPPDTQQFVVETIGATQVVLKLSGGLLPDGTDTVTLKEGESITLYNATAKRSYKIKLVDVRTA